MQLDVTVDVDHHRGHHDDVIYVNDDVINVNVNVIVKVMLSNWNPQQQPCFRPIAQVKYALSVIVVFEENLQRNNSLFNDSLLLTASKITQRNQLSFPFFYVS